jgi:hypothetical protein
MNNYRINFLKNQRDEVLHILRQSNDIIIDNIGDFSIGFTIERDNAEEIYEDLLEKIDHQLYQPKNSASS